MTSKSKKFLLADDDREDQELLREAILDLSPQTTIHLVANGKEVIDYLTNCSDSDLPCLIILDYNMPKGNGPEVLDILNQDQRFDNIPIIIWSTSGSLDYIAECSNKGARAFFLKPDNFSQLKNMVNQILAIVG